MKYIDNSSSEKLSESLGLDHVISFEFNPKTGKYLVYISSKNNNNEYKGSYEFCVSFDFLVDLTRNALEALFIESSDSNNNIRSRAWLIDHPEEQYKNKKKLKERTKNEDEHLN